MVTVVNRQLTPRATINDRLLLTDILFSPSTPRWDPFAHSLDFPRTKTKEILDQLNILHTQSPNENIGCVIHGGAASGKTSLLKRLAFDLASNGNLVLWQKPCFLPDPGRNLRPVFAEIAKLPKTEKGRLVYIIDDPVSSGNFTPDLIPLVARAANLNITLIIGIRTTDWSSAGKIDITQNIPSCITYHLEDKLTTSEQIAFPEYLVRLGICSTITEGQQRCADFAQRTARDTLSMLYWLLPQTRSSITNSVRDELFRLGDIAGFRQIVIGDEIHSTAILRDAYEMVAVSENFRAPLPVEVLVAALGIDYAPWLATTKIGAPAWGLLYCDDSPDGATSYRTRHALVTEMLVETINGGTLGHTGELRVLTRLINACHGRRTAVYREYCVRLLVPYTKISQLAYSEGLGLFDAAIEALPLPDRTLLHHKALWIKNIGHDPASAAATLEEALATPDYPYTNRGEADEHIHTSLAATILDGIDSGAITLSEGKVRVFDHLAKARSEEFFNANAVHVQANLAIRIVVKIDANERPDAFAIVTNALADIDLSLLLLSNPVFPEATRRSDVQALEQIREKLFLSISDIDDLDAEATRLWECFHCQDGFIVSARKHLDSARTKNRGSAFRKAYDFCLTARHTIESKGVPVSPRLSEVQLQIYYYWMVIRKILSSHQSGPDWQLVTIIVTETLQDRSNARNPLYRFIYAVALAHCGEWSLANAEFSQLRQSSLPLDVLWRPRCLLLNDLGGAKRVQGVIRDSVDRKTFQAPTLGIDLYCDRKCNWGRDGETAHSYVQFAFGGATAIDELT